jgi:hypothetical protein
VPSRSQSVELVFFQALMKRGKIYADVLGWMTVCDRCHLQVDFFGEVMN